MALAENASLAVAASARRESDGVLSQGWPPPYIPARAKQYGLDGTLHAFPGRGVDRPAVFPAVKLFEGLQPSPHERVREEQ